MIAFREGSENGGPYNSHKRIMESSLKDRYSFVPLIVPKGKMGLFNVKLLKNLIKQIEEISPDAVQIIGLELIGFYLSVACKMAKVNNIILAIHGSTTEAIDFNKNPFKRLIMEILEIYTLKTATVTYGVSKYVKTIKNVEKFSRNYYGEIYNMLIETNCEYNILESREEFSISNSQIVIISTGRIIREKGYDVMTRIVKHYKDNDRVTFLIVGDGNYRFIMERELTDQIKQKQVKLLGYRSDIAYILSTGDIFVMPSYHETLCMSLVEAGQSGMALIASNVGGMREVIDNGVTGYLVEPGNDRAFIQKIDYLLDHEEQLERMKLLAKKYVNIKFSNNEIVRRLSSMYESILGE